MYSSEKTDIVKIAPLLSEKVLYPTSFERQNVSLAVKLFNEKNVAALKTLQDTNVNGTLQFLELISNWWTCVNVKHPLKGKHLRDKLADPIRKIDSNSVKFLESFLKWLEEWENIGADTKRQGKLTSETQSAVYHTTKTLICIVKYLLQELQFKYVLLGKFQTDHLEGRFGKYRQMSGANYNISIVQILESEKKLKIMSLLKLNSAKLGDFKIRDIMGHKGEEHTGELENNEGGNENNYLDTFSSIIEEYEMVEVSESNMMSLIYIAGYVARGVERGINCDKCRSLLSYDRPLECDNQCAETTVYLKILDRGGLKWPTDFVLRVTVCTFKVFQCLISINYENEFLKIRNQRHALQCLSCDALGIVNSVCECGVSSDYMVKRATYILANIMLNNYCKIKQSDAASTSRAKRKALIYSQ